MPAKATKEVKSLSKKRGFSSVSSYIRYLVDMDKELISEADLLKSVDDARKEYKAGKSIKAKSLADLV